MEVTMACLASLVWFIVFGSVVPPKPQPSNKLDCREAGQQVQELPTTLTGNVSPNVAPNSFAAPQAPNFDEAIVELKMLQRNRIESRTIADLTTQAVKNNDKEACQQLQTSSTTMLIYTCSRTLEGLTNVHASDIASLRTLVSHTTEVPLAIGFTAAGLEACAERHENDLALDARANINEADAAAQRPSCRTIHRRIRFAKQSEVYFFSLPLRAAMRPQDAHGPLEYTRSLETKVFDGPSGHQARRTLCLQSKASTHVCVDAMSPPSSCWDHSVSESSSDLEDQVLEDVEDWEDWCDDIAELMAHPRSCLLWSPL
jgi:hypothetical protein